jgi:hypothetical protein
MSCECGGYCHKCRGMIMSLFGVLLMLNAFIWPKWTGTDGWLAFLGLLLMVSGVWKAYINGCSCPKTATCSCKTDALKEAPAVHKGKKRKK